MSRKRLAYEGEKNAKKVTTAGLAGRVYRQQAGTTGKNPEELSATYTASGSESGGRARVNRGKKKTGGKETKLGVLTEKEAAWTRRRKSSDAPGIGPKGAGQKSASTSEAWTPLLLRGGWGGQQEEKVGERYHQ